MLSSLRVLCHFFDVSIIAIIAGVLDFRPFVQKIGTPVITVLKKNLNMNSSFLRFSKIIFALKASRRQAGGRTDGLPECIMRPV